MKTITKFLSLALVAGLALSSCKKDDPDPNPYEEPGFSSYSAEKNKQNLEDAGIKLANELDDLTDAEAILAAQQLGNLNSGASTKKAIEGVGVVKMLASADDNATKLKAFLEDTPITTAMDDIEGIYTWNPAIEDFDMAEANNKVVFLFPYDENSTTNDCELSLSVTPVAVSGEIIPELTEAFSNVTMKLTVKGTEASSLVVDAEYSKGVPSYFKSTLKVATYKWEFTANQNSSKVSSDFLFAHGTTTLMNYGFEIGGNLNLDDVEAYTSKFDTLTDYQQGIVTEGGTYIADVKSYYQIMNVKLVETANTKEIAAAIDNIINKYGSENIDGSDAAQNEIVAVMNDKINIFLMYDDTNQKIADVQFYITEVTHTNEWEEYNPMTQQYETVTDTYTSDDIMPQFIFGENESPVDANAYFQDGFDDFQNEMDSMFQQFEDMMSSWEQESSDQTASM